MIYGLPQRLIAMRKKFPYSQRQVAARLGVSPALISSYESGDRTPSLEMLLKLSSIYQCSTDYLLGKNTTGVENGISLEGLTPRQVNILTTLLLEFQQADGSESE